jgi:colanic acid/amylovoran biosynthesis glycosyltransferase
MTDRARHLGYVLKRFPRISETFVASELIELGRQGEQVTIFALSRPDEPFMHAFLYELKARVVYLPHRPLREPIRVAGALARVLRSDLRGWLGAAGACLWPPRLHGWRRLLQATVLRDEMTRAGIDHAHAHFASTAARLANLAWRMGGPTYSVTAHAKDIYHREVRADRLREKLEAATFVATVTAANQEYLESVLRGRVRLQVVANSVDVRRLGSPPRERDPEADLVLAVARLVEKKGLTDLVLACGLLAARGVDLRLEIVGDGPLRDALEETALLSQAPVTFRGALPQEEVLELYPRAAVFCLPCVVASNGDRDGLPTSVLEAMVHGVPVVTTAVNGLGELVVHGRTGLIVPERDPCALADAVGYLLADPDLAEQLGAEGRRLVESEFTLERSVSSLRSLFPEPA